MDYVDRLSGIMVAQPNYAHALDAAMTILFHSNAHWRRASDVCQFGRGTAFQTCLPFVNADPFLLSQDCAMKRFIISGVFLAVVCAAVLAAYFVG